MPEPHIEIDAIKKEQIGDGLHTAFLITILLNGLVGLGDLSVAALFLLRGLFGTALIELSESRGIVGSVALKLHDTILSLSTQDHRLIVIYFLSHGLIKLFLAIMLLLRKLWAYPLAITCFSLFCAYSIYSLFAKISPLNIFLLVLNTFVLVLVSREYIRIKKAFAVD